MSAALDKLLDSKTCAAVAKIGYDRVYEIRLRAGRAATVNVGGSFYYLGAGGASAYRADAFVFKEKEIADTVYRAADYSIYAVEAQLCQSFITLQGGLRVGVCGTVVLDGDRVRTVRDVGSVVIRVPHEVKGCSDAVSVDNGSVLIASPPACGKTTFLRDIARRCSRSAIVNTVVLDERGEIAACRDGTPMLDVGDADVLTDCDKSYGFRHAVRVMRPDVLVTDELMTEEDFEAVRKAVRSGIRVFASVHAETDADLKTKPLSGIFDRIVLLGKGGKPGIVVQEIEGDAL